MLTFFSSIFTAFLWVSFCLQCYVVVMILPFGNICKRFCVHVKLRGDLGHLKTLVYQFIHSAHQNLPQLKHPHFLFIYLFFCFLFSHRGESRLSNSGWRGQYFDIQQPETGKVRKNSAGITCSLQQCILMLQQERCPSLSAYTELDSKLASCTRATASKCPQVSSVNYPLSMFITNSGLCILI